MTDLSRDAKYVLGELVEKPYNDTPDAIYAACQIQQVEAEDVANGLEELGARGLAVEQGGRWRVTQAGVDWVPPS